MRFLASLAVLLWTGAMCAQTPAGPDEPEIARAKAGIEKLRTLLEAGVIPRAQVERAESALADAQDRATLRHTLYGQDLTEDQADGMITAARRLYDRRIADLESGKKLVQEGVSSQASLGTFLEELDRARKEYDLAESRARVIRNLTQMAKAEQIIAEPPPPDVLLPDSHEIAERFDGTGMFSASDLAAIEHAFNAEFDKSLPVSALGETATHRALGFDHRGRVDVALNPDQAEGVWLRKFLTVRQIPYFAFRQAVPGKATGAHIHIGPISTRISKGG